MIFFFFWGGGICPHASVPGNKVTCVSVLDETDERQADDRQQGLDGGRRSRNRGRYLVMGEKTQEGRLIVSYVRSLDRQRSRELSRAMRAMRRQTTTICLRDSINAAFASASPPYRGAKNRNRSRKKKGGDEKSTANEMTKTGRRASKHRRRSSAPSAEIETET